MVVQGEDLLEIVLAQVRELDLVEEQGEIVEDLLLTDPCHTIRPLSSLARPSYFLCLLKPQLDVVRVDGHPTETDVLLRGGMGLEGEEDVKD